MKKTDLYLKPGTYIKASTTQGEVQGTSLENFVVSVLNNPTCCPKPVFIKDGMLMTAAYLDTSLQTVTDQGPNSSPLKLSTLLVRVESALEIAERLRLEADSTVTTQTSSVIQATTTNANLVIAPNGTGALVASIPDGTPTGGGNARGQYAVDLKIGGRTVQTQVASGNYSVVLGGNTSTASGNFSIAGGSATASGTNSVALGGSSTASGSGSVAIGGEQGGGLGCTASGRAAIAFGMANQASADWSNSLGGINNVASSQYSTISGGQSNTASTGTHATIMGGRSNTASGQFSVSVGDGNTASNFRSGALSGGGLNVSGQQSVIAGGNDQTITGNFSSMIGGQLNTIGNGTHNTLSGGRSNGINNGVDYSFLGGGQSNTISGASGGADWGVICGGLSNQIENTYTSILGGNNNYAFGPYSSVLGTKDGYSYLFGSTVSSGGLFTTRGDAQQTSLTARREASLNSAATTVLSLDGTGTTNLIIPNGNNRLWAVKVVATAFVSVAGGTLVLGDSYMGEFTLLFKRVGGTSSVVGVNSANLIYDTNMATAAFTFAAGASQDLQITFKAPTTASATTFRCVAKVELVEVAY